MLSNGWNTVPTAARGVALERVPHLRDRHAPTARVAQYLPWAGALKVSYRFYADDWGTVAHSAEAELDQRLNAFAWLGATARLGWDPYLHNPKLRGRLRRITAPTLIVAGAEDGLVPLAYAETFAAEIPGARLEVIEGAAHWLPFEKPDELAALVRSFL